MYIAAILILLHRVEVCGVSHLVHPLFHGVFLPKLRNKNSSIELSLYLDVKIENDIWAIPAHYIRLEKLTYSVNFLSSTLYPPNI